MRLRIRGRLASWEAQLRRSSNPYNPSDDGFVARVSLSEIRREILRPYAHVTPSTALAGRIFQEVVAELMGPRGWQAALEPEELADEGRLARHVYEKLLGPRVTSVRASFQESGEETLALWEAVRAMCGWVGRRVEAASQRGVISFNRWARAWKGTGSLCRPGHVLRWELRDPGWTAPVVVSGAADAIWIDPDTSRWCVLEYQPGHARPDADLTLASLYYAALVSSGLASDDEPPALLTFGPELQEHSYSTDQLGDAQPALCALIGRLAGVLPEQAAFPKLAPEPAHVQLGERLVRALKHHGIAVKWNREVIAGPTFLRYPMMPGRRIPIQSILEKASELGVQLALEEPPLIQVTGGRLMLDVQRLDRRIVPFSAISEQILPTRGAGSSLVPLGVDLGGTLQFADLASPDNPHLLVAGTAGSGKSEWLRSAIAGLIWANTPETLRLVLIDPKRSAFAELKGSHYLYGPRSLIYPPEDCAMNTLQALIGEMETRYQHLSNHGATDLADLRQKTGEALPRIVCVCDEYAELIVEQGARKEVEGAIARLGPKARAVGIHLVIATQYPDRNIVGGALQMNLAGRICLRTTNAVQSNMILHQSGAEKLLGMGDLFFLGAGDPVRLQAPYLSAMDREAIFNRASARSSAARGA